MGPKNNGPLGEPAAVMQITPNSTTSNGRSIMSGMALRPLALLGSIFSKGGNASSQSTLPMVPDHHGTKGGGTRPSSGEEEETRDTMPKPCPPHLIHDGGNLDEDAEPLFRELMHIVMQPEEDPCPPHATPNEGNPDEEAEPLFEDLKRIVTQPNDPTASSRRRLKIQIEAYLGQAYVEQVYGDFLSGRRTRLYEPQWPPSAATMRRPPPHEPKSQQEAKKVQEALLAPLLPWYSLSEEDARTPEAVRTQRKIQRALDQYERETGARLWREKFQGDLLYRNLPDAGTELRVRMLLTRTQIALQQRHITRAEDLVDEALILVTKLDYHPITAKCWYWKCRVADMRGSSAEAAECLLNALPCVGKYIEGEYLSRYVLDYKEEMLDFLCSRGEVSERERSTLSRKIDRAAAGVEPLVLPSPEPLPPRHDSPEPPSPPQIGVRSKASISPAVFVAREDIISGQNRASPVEGDLIATNHFDKIRDHHHHPVPIRLQMPEEHPDGGSLPETTRKISALKSLPSPGVRRLSKTDVFRLYEALDPQFQRQLSMDAFVEGADDDLDLDWSLASKVVLYTRLMNSRYRMSRRASVKTVDTRPNIPESTLGIDYQPPGSTNLQQRRSKKAKGKSSSDFRLTQSAEERWPIIRGHLTVKTKDDADPMDQQLTQPFYLRYPGEWQAMIATQNATRETRIGSMQQSLPRTKPADIRNLIRREEQLELRKKFGKNLPDPHQEAWKRLDTQQQQQQRPQTMHQEPKSRMKSPNGLNLPQRSNTVAHSQAPPPPLLPVHNPGRRQELATKVWPPPRAPIPAGMAKGTRAQGNNSQPPSPSPLRRSSLPGEGDDEDKDFTARRIIIDHGLISADTEDSSTDSDRTVTAEREVEALDVPVSSDSSSDGSVVTAAGEEEEEELEVHVSPPPEANGDHLQLAPGAHAELLVGGGSGRQEPTEEQLVSPLAPPTTTKKARRKGMIFAPETLVYDINETF